MRFHVQSISIICTALLLYICSFANDSATLIRRIQDLESKQQIASTYFDSQKQFLDQANARLDRDHTRFEILLGLFSLIVAGSWYMVHKDSKKNLAETENLIRTYRQELENLKRQGERELDILRQMRARYEDKSDDLIDAVITYKLKGKEGNEEISKLQLQKNIVDALNVISKEPVPKEKIVSKVDAAVERQKKLYYDLMEIEIENKNWSEANIAIENYIRFDKTRPEVFFKYGKSLFSIKQYHKAMQQFERAIILRSNDCEALLFLLKCCELLNLESRAKEIKDEMIKAGCKLPS